jgi:hypothetical protein
MNKNNGLELTSYLSLISLVFWFQVSGVGCQEKNLAVALTLNLMSEFVGIRILHSFFLYLRLFPESGHQSLPVHYFQKPLF